MRFKLRVGKKVLSFLLTLAMVLGVLPGMSMTVQATTFYGDYLVNYNDNATTLGNKVVHFNNMDWYVIKDESTSRTSGTLTLLSKDIIGQSKFNNIQSKEYKNSTVETYLKTYFDNNFTGLSSTIEDVVPGPDGAMEDNGNTAKLWLLSGTEVLAMNSLFYAGAYNTEALKASTAWWLRECYDMLDSGGIIAKCVYGTGSSINDHYGVSDTRGVRPAMKLKLDKVTFNSGTFSKNIKSISLAGAANSNRSGGATSQNVTGAAAMTTVTYTAESGYYFPAFNSISQNGVTITRTSDYVVTVSGIPTGDVSLTVPNAVAIQNITATASDVVYAYDGNSHGITVNVTAPVSGATIRYGTSAGNYNLPSSPTITNVSQSPLTVYYQVTATGYYTKTGSATVTINKSDIAAPSAPTKYNSTANSITLVAHDGYEYKCGDGDWQTGNVFDGLAPGTAYNFYQRIIGDGNHNNSASSTVATFRTTGNSFQDNNSSSGDNNGGSNGGTGGGESAGGNTSGGNNTSGNNNSSNNSTSNNESTTVAITDTPYYKALDEDRKKLVPLDYVDRSGSPMYIEGKHVSWNDVGGKSYWYENGIKQGTYFDNHAVLGDGTVRGREIYDAGSDNWYWLDTIYDGAKAIGKEVWMPYIYQDEDKWDDEKKAGVSGLSDPGMQELVLQCMREKKGKWVRYDEKGAMLKGWVTIQGTLAEKYPKQVGNTYYYDTQTGLMARGWITIDGTQHFFNEITGVLEQ